MRLAIAMGLTVSALAIAAGGAAQDGARLSSECRREIVQLCGMGNFRQCLTEKHGSLSESCRSELMTRARTKLAQPGQPAAGAQEIAYGSDAAQRFDLTLPQGASGPVPVVVFVHGGGWSIGDKAQGAGVKAPHFNGLGYGFASLNYRLVPKATVEQQAADIATAIAKLRQTPGVDGNRIVLMGHSAGAHLAALVGTDPHYFQAANVPLTAVRGVVLLDGAGYDVPQQMAEPGNRVEAMYSAAFGADPARQRALSPITHAGAPNIARWLIIPVASRADSTAQSRALADALVKGGSTATVSPAQAKTHMTLNRELGAAGDAPTADVDRFVAAAFGG